MNKTYKYTLTAHEKKEISFDTGVARLAIANGDGVDGSTTVVMSEITKQHSGEIVSFLDGSDAPFADFIVNIEAVQSGSGDPSPDNVRPISGWTGANIYVSGEDTSTPTTYNINWQSTAGTVYGGTLDVKTGELIITYTTVDLGTLNYYTGFNGFYTDSLRSVIKYGTDSSNVPSILAPIYKTLSFNSFFNGQDDFVVSMVQRNYSESYNGFVLIRDSRYSTPVELKAALDGVSLVYPLATPVTYQLTPTEIRSLLGVNNVWADCGPVNVRYFVQSTQPMIDYIDDKTENVVEVFKATGHYGGTYTLDDVTCDELCTYARDHSNIVIKATRASSAISYDIFILSDYIGTSAVFRNAIITTAIGGGYVLEVNELQADSGNNTNALTVRQININADS